jgi:HSP20 family protein
MSHDVIRLLRVLFQPGTETSLEVPWRPAADVYRTPDGWVIKFDLAGVRTEDIDLEVSGNTMVLRGTRRDCAPAGSQIYQMEIAYSRFERALRLPCDLSKAEIQTNYRDGLLFVAVRKGESQS